MGNPRKIRKVPGDLSVDQQNNVVHKPLGLKGLLFRFWMFIQKVSNAELITGTV